MRLLRRHQALGALLASCGACGALAAPAPSGLQQDVAFSDYTPLSASAELVRRLLSPLAAAQVQAQLSQSDTQLIEQSIDLKDEKFVLYVPAQAPAQGYALLVFVPPWPQARLPPGWQPVLDRYGMIYVSAARSGNDENVMARREPLALLAAYNVMQRYPVDASRVYVGGFSGGSRIALRLALGYPDLFSGALLNAGSDALGTLVPPLPRADLWQRFQERSHLVYVTGEHDGLHLQMDADSLGSMRKWCVFGTDDEITPGAAHELASPAALAGALHVLSSALPLQSAKLAACRADIDRQLAARLQQVQSLTGSGRQAEAQKSLLEIDRRFGGLAAPRTLELQSASK